MNFRLEEAIEILERTPGTLARFLGGLSDVWLHADEGEGTWTPAQVVDHLVEAEHTNWIPRLIVLLEQGETATFPPFDRFAHLQEKSDSSIADKCLAFESVRRSNAERLRSLIGSDDCLERKGLHPAFGPVTAAELISAWVVHDLTHLSQIVRVMAGRYRTDVGPYREYLSVLKREDKAE